MITKCCQPQIGTVYRYDCDNCHKPIKDLTSMKARLIDGLLFDFCGDVCDLDFYLSRTYRHPDETINSLVIV